MRILPIMENGELIDAAHDWIVTCMIFPDDDREREQIGSVMALERVYRSENEALKQSETMAKIDKTLSGYETLGRMVGELVTQMIVQNADGQLVSVNSACKYILEKYENQGIEHPRDPRRLKEHFRRFKNSANLWAALQHTSISEFFEFSTKPAMINHFLLHAGLYQIGIEKIDYFAGWNPWCVPIKIIQEIHDTRLSLRIDPE